MDKVNGKQARLGSINWSVLQGGPSTKPTEAPAPKAEEPKLAKADSLDVNTPPKGASGATVKDQVLKIDNEIVKLDRALEKTNIDLTTAHVERARLSDALEAKVKEAEELAGKINVAEEQKARIAGQIAQIKGAIAGLNDKISDLKDEQASLLAKEAVLAKKHRSLYDQAMSDANYANYLKGLSSPERADGSVNMAQKAANSEDAKKAKEALGQTERELADTNTSEAVNDIERHFLSFKRLRLQASGEAKVGELKVTQGKINDLQDKETAVGGQIHQAREQIEATDAKIAQTEKVIDSLQGRIDELRQLRDDILAQAIKDKMQDAKEIRDQLAKLDELMKKLGDQLKQTQADLKDLKDLRTKQP